MKRIVTVLGARPQFIKASVVSAAMEETGKLKEVVVHTGQHFDKNMSDVFFQELGMKAPNYNLGISGGGHGEMTGRMLSKVEKVLLKEKPDIVLVYGDTNSTLAGALAAVKLQIPVAHVEAGLRSFNRAMPEEINRVLTDRISRWLFAPTDDAVRRLQSEGVPQEHIFQVGDVMYDVALRHGSRADPKGGIPGKLNLKPRSYVLATVHRAENTDNPDRLGAIVMGLQEVANSIPVVWPVHPRTREILGKGFQPTNCKSNFHLIEPAGYLEMVGLLRHAAVIATDSGGVQKEAFFHQVPCVTLREETEWVELLASGWSRLCPPKKPQKITRTILAAQGTSGQDTAPYGCGNAAVKIAKALAKKIA